jgi:flagellar motor switch protein FliG
MAETQSGAEARGPRKAAIFIVSVDQETAARVLTHLDRETQEKIALEISRLEITPPTKEERDTVLKEFYNLSLAHQYVEQGGPEYARQLLEKVLPPEDVRQIMGAIETAMKLSPFGFLQKADADNVLAFIQEEHPQTIALIVAYLPPSQASAILEGLTLKKQQEVIKRLATMEHTSPDVVSQVEKSLEAKLSAFITQESRRAGGIEQVAEILNLVQRVTERSILEGLEEEDPEMVEQIRRLMFTFEDIMRVNDRGIQNLLKNVDHQQLSVALKTAPPELRDKFFKNMSKRAVEMVQEEMEYMGPVRLKDVEAAQQAIVDLVRRLEEQGELVVEGRGGEEVVV